MKVTFVEYQSERWRELCEWGWMTESVDYWQQGKERMAKMVKETDVNAYVKRLWEGRDNYDA
jgi:hypothetical protein